MLCPILPPSHIKIKQLHPPAIKSAATLLSKSRFHVYYAISCIYLSEKQTKRFPCTFTSQVFIPSFPVKTRRSPYLSCSLSFFLPFPPFPLLHIPLTTIHQLAPQYTYSNQQDQTPCIVTPRTKANTPHPPSSRIKIHKDQNL